MRWPAISPPDVQHPVYGHGLIYESDDNSPRFYCRHIYMGTRGDLLVAGIVTAAMFPDRRHRMHEQNRRCTLPGMPRWCVKRLRLGYYRVELGDVEDPVLPPPHPSYARETGNPFARLAFYIPGVDHLG